MQYFYFSQYFKLGDFYEHKWQYVNKQSVCKIHNFNQSKFSKRFEQLLECYCNG